MPRSTSGLRHEPAACGPAHAPARLGWPFLHCPQVAASPRPGSLPRQGPRVQDGHSDCGELLFAALTPELRHVARPASAASLAAHCTPRTGGPCRPVVQQGKYRLGRKIGSGSFGDIYIGAAGGGGPSAPRKAHGSRGPRHAAATATDGPYMLPPSAGTHLLTGEEVGIKLVGATGVCRGIRRAAAAAHVAAGWLGHPVHPGQGCGPRQRAVPLAKGLGSAAVATATASPPPRFTPPPRPPAGVDQDQAPAAALRKQDLQDPAGWQ